MKKSAPKRSETRLTLDQQVEVRRRMHDPRPVFASDEKVEAFFSKIIPHTLTGEPRT